MLQRLDVNLRSASAFASLGRWEKLPPEHPLSVGEFMGLLLETKQRSGSQQLAQLLTQAEHKVLFCVSPSIL